MATIVVLGAGVMGSAFTMPLADNGHHVRLVGTHLDADIIEEIHETRVHPRLKSRLRDTVEPYTYDRLGEAMQGVDLVVVGVNSLGIDWAGEMLRPVLPEGIPVLFLTKGLAGEGDSLELLPHRLRAHLTPSQQARTPLVAIGGPSIAGELAEGRDTCVVIAGNDAAFLNRLASMVRTPYYHVWPSTDLVGVETCVALKNIYALAVGCVGGLLAKAGKAGNEAVMYNLAAAIFAQGLWETAYMVDYMGGQRRSVFTLPGAGDLYVTSMGGRNSRMGWHLGQGAPYSVAKRDFMPDDTIEGAQLAQAIGPTVEALMAQGKLDPAALPLMARMIDIVTHDAPVEFPWDAFFAGQATG
ncbi:MAG: glycerol-3-phosphate dehydrogenase [Caldilineaceae bacterium]|jgi:glycerol-3-phosphate dehydrogenase (NAD(P)+)|nr:glycerol-3-phosphate dehydrogenase [Caldilineaceae bacterium]